MRRTRWARPNECDHVVVLVADDGRLRRALRDRLGSVPGRGDGDRDGKRYPRYRVLVASSVADARRRAAEAGVVAIDLSLRGASGLELIRELRDGRADLALLAYARSADASDAIAAVMAGADFFHECTEERCEGFERSLELAVDRRRLTRLIERNQEETEAARGRLAQLAGDLVLAVPGFRPLHAPEDVLPFREAARRYLLAAVRLFEGDARGLARALGVSYFAMRRLLARYEVPFPGIRSRK